MLNWISSRAELEIIASQTALALDAHSSVSEPRALRQFASRRERGESDRSDCCSRCWDSSNRQPATPGGWHVYLSRFGKGRGPSGIFGGIVLHLWRIQGLDWGSPFTRNLPGPLSCPACHLFHPLVEAVVGKKKLQPPCSCYGNAPVDQEQREGDALWPSLGTRHSGHGAAEAEPAVSCKG